MFSAHLQSLCCTTAEPFHMITQRCLMSYFSGSKAGWFAFPFERPESLRLGTRVQSRIGSCIIRTRQTGYRHNNGTRSCIMLVPNVRILPRASRARSCFYSFRVFFGGTVKMVVVLTMMTIMMMLRAVPCPRVHHAGEAYRSI